MDKNLLQKAKAPMIALIQTKNIMKTNNLKTKTRRAAALLLMLALLAPLATRAQEETFTVYDDSYTDYGIPAAIGAFDHYTRSQFIIPAADLTLLAGGTINGMRFYATTSFTPNDHGGYYYYTRSVDVYLTEVDYSLFDEDNPQFEPKDNATVVYQGELIILKSNGLLTISFDENFEYGGGNLLVGIENTELSDSPQVIPFYGSYVDPYTTPAISNFGGENIWQSAFIPKTTFFFEPDCGSPETLVADVITPMQATLTWTGGSGTYNVETKSSNSGWTRVLTETTATTCTMNLDIFGNYQARVMSVCDDGGISPWREVTFTNRQSHTVYDGSNNSIQCPTYPSRFNWFTKSQFIIPAEDLSTMVGGTITTMKFYCNSSFSWTDCPVEVYLKPIDRTHFSSNPSLQFEPLDDATSVYYGGIRAVSNDHYGGELTIPIYDGYVYEGGNLFVCIENTQKGSAIPGINFQGTYAQYASVAGANESSLDEITPSYCQIIPMTTFIYNPECAERPENLAAQYIGTHQTMLSWTGGSGTYNVETKTGDGEWTRAYTDLAANTCTLENLAEATDYEARVQSVCGNHVTGWRFVSFSTICEPLALTIGTSYFEGFESPEGTPWTQTGPIADCWDAYTTSYSNVAPHNTIGSSGAPHHVHSGTQSLSFSSNMDDNYALFPVFEQPLGDLQVSFWMRTVNAGSDQLRLGYITHDDNGTCNTFTEIASYNSNTGSMVQRSTTLENVPDEAWRLVFKWSSNDGRCFVDDVEVSINPAMILPRDIAATNITPHAADIIWEGQCDSYALRYQQVSLAPEPLLNEGFEGGTMPQGWTIEGASQDPAKTWRVGVGDYYTSTGTHSGSYNALITHNTSNQVTYLVMPAFDLGGYGSAELSFWYVNRIWSGDIDEFAVCYRIGNEGEWNELWSTTENHQAWTSQTVALTGLADGYQIGFRFTDHYGYGVGLDDIALSGVPLSEWITVSEVESPYTLTGLTPETTYEVQVQGTYGGSTLDWSETVTFTTLEACPVPFNVAASDITPTEVAVSWTGYSDSYNLSYRRVPSTTPETILNEGFEGGTMPQGWTIEGASQDPAKTWRVGVGDHFSETGTHSGNYNALITHNARNQVTYLVMPTLDLGEYGSAELSFWYINKRWGNDTDEFGVCYRIGNEGEWNELWNTTDYHYAWTSQSVALTGLADGYQIGFRFTDHYGWGVGLDDIALSGVFSNPSWITLSEAESPQAIASLRPETEYEVKVQGICDGIPTEWSQPIAFSTPACTVPGNLAVSDITATGATLTWTGTSVDYNVQLGVIAGSIAIVDEDFSEAIPASWDNGSNYPWTIVDGHMQSSNGGIHSTSSAISLTMTFPVGGTIEFDAECKGEGSSTIYDKCIFTIDGEQQFCYGANMPGWNHYSYTVDAGTHTFTWSYTKDGSVNPTGDYFAVDNVVVAVGECIWEEPLLANGESITLSALTPSTTYYAQVQGICDGISTDWSEIVSFTTLEQTTATQTIELVSGWNWVSFNVETTLDGLKAALLEALPGTAISIKSQTQNTSYKPNNNRWVGSLAWDVAKMYMIKVVGPCEITFEGMPINPAEHPVSILNGANWIGFPLNSSITLSNAFADFAANGDRIKSQTNNALYNGIRWQGQLNTLVPNSGYIYISNSEEERTFIFPISTR